MIGIIKAILNYRELIKNLVLKELRLRHQNSLLGFSWTLVHPLLLALVFTLVFSCFLKVKPEGSYSYVVFLLCALMPWQFLAASLTDTTSSIVKNSNLLQKAVFPKEILVISAILTNLVVFVLSLVVIFIVFVVFFKVVPSYEILFIPLIIAIQLIFILGISFITACFNVFFRDVEYILQVILTGWFFISPTIYPINSVVKTTSGLAFTLYMLNPMAPLIAAYRRVLIGQKYAEFNLFKALSVAAIISLVILFIGYFIFKKCEPQFAEKL